MEGSKFFLARHFGLDPGSNVFLDSGSLPRGGNVRRSY
jgi:hypothetical protein